MGRTPKNQHWARSGEPWTPAEDRWLLRLIDEGTRLFPGVSLSSLKPGPSTHAAQALERTASAIQTRLGVLRAAGFLQRSEVKA